MQKQIGGLTVAYDDAGTGKPVVLLHAFPLSGAMWRPQVEALARHFRLIVPDQRGFGGTGGFEGEPSVEVMADDAARLLDALDVAGPVVLGGLSMGGYVALAFARRYPERLRALVLADTRAEADTAEGKANRDQMIALAREHPARDVIELMLPKLLSEATRMRRPEVVEEVRRIASAQSPAGIVGALRALRERPDSTPFLGNIRVPTLVIAGEEDALTPLAVGRQMAGRIPGARVEGIPEAGHLSNLERPDLFNGILQSFLKSLP